jgi:hypothetical protein
MPPGEPHPNPQVVLLRHARREALIVLAVWALFLAWVVGYSYLRGYIDVAEGSGARPAPEVETTAGLPQWVFYGIALPWLAATLFTIFFGWRLLRDDDLGPDREELPGQARDATAGPEGS